VLTLKINHRLDCIFWVRKQNQDAVTQGFNDTATEQHALSRNPVGNLSHAFGRARVSQRLEDGCTTVQIRENNRRLNAHSR
jgi:hypothetical protein